MSHFVVSPKCWILATTDRAFPHDELKPLTGTWTDSLPELGPQCFSILYIYFVYFFVI